MLSVDGRSQASKWHSHMKYKWWMHAETVGSVPRRAYVMHIQVSIKYEAKSNWTELRKPRLGLVRPHLNCPKCVKCVPGLMCLLIQCAVCCSLPRWVWFLMLPRRWIGINWLSTCIEWPPSFTVPHHSRLPPLGTFQRLVFNSLTLVLFYKHQSFRRPQRKKSRSVRSGE